MDLVNLVQSMSLEDSSKEESLNLKVFACKIKEHHTDFVFGEFENKILLIATQYEKIGSLLKISVDQVPNGIDISDPVYTISVVFGADLLEHQVAARYIAEKLNIQKPLMLFLCLKNYDPESVKLLVEALLSQSASAN